MSRHVYGIALSLYSTLLSVRLEFAKHLGTRAVKVRISCDNLNRGDTLLLTVCQDTSAWRV